MTPQELAPIMPSDLTVFIGSTIFSLFGIAVIMERNGYDFYMSRYYNILSEYCNGTQEIINNEMLTDKNKYYDEYYDDISHQFDNFLCFL